MGERRSGCQAWLSRAGFRWPCVKPAGHDDAHAFAIFDRYPPEEDEPTGWHCPTCGHPVRGDDLAMLIDQEATDGK